MTDSATTTARPFLERFEPARRSIIVNMFLNAYRVGVREPHAIVQHVTRDAIRRRARARISCDFDDEQKAQALLDALDAAPDEALELARWAATWESLPRAEREAIKSAQTERYRAAWMERQPATAAQMQYLQALGHRGPVASRAEASRLIDALTRERRR